MRGGVYKKGGPSSFWETRARNLHAVCLQGIQKGTVKSQTKDRGDLGRIKAKRAYATNAPGSRRITEKRVPIELNKKIGKNGPRCSEWGRLNRQ